MLSAYGSHGHLMFTLVSAAIPLHAEVCVCGLLLDLGPFWVSPHATEPGHKEVHNKNKLG